MTSPLHILRLGLGRTMSRQMDRSARISARLATGRRVVQASDDPSGMARGVRSTARLRSFAAVERNIQTGIDALRTADSGLESIGERLDRLRTLALRAANGAMNDVDRAGLDQEATEVLLHIEAIARPSRFNGDRLLTTHKVDVGFLLDTSGSMSGELAAVRSSIEAFRQRFEDAGLDVQFGLAEVFGPADRSDSIRQRADIGDESFLGELAGLRVAGGAVDPYAGFYHASGADEDSEDAFTWRKRAAERHLIYVTDTRREYDALPGAETQASIAAELREARVTAHVIGDDRFDSHFRTLTGNTGGTLLDKGNAQGDLIEGAMAGLSRDITAGFGSLSVDFQIGPDGGDQFKTGLPIDATLDGLELAEISLESAEEAREALGAIEAAQEMVLGHRANVGAAHRRMDAMLSSTRSQLDIQTESLGRLEDADMAREVAESVKTRVLIDAALSIIAQVDQMERDTLLRMLS